MPFKSPISEDLTADYQKKINIFYAELKEKGFDSLISKIPENEIATIFLFSDFIYRTLLKNPALLSELIESGDLKTIYDKNEYDRRVYDSLKDARDDAEIGLVLRRIRQREMIRIAWRDLYELSDLTETLVDLSTFADACIKNTISKLSDLLERDFGTPVSPGGHPSELITLSMGKLGAGELNFSSDIDLVFVYPDAGKTAFLSDRNYTDSTVDPITNEEFFTKLARRFAKIFSEATDQGIVFRVDLRLRPYGDSGPIVMSIDALEDYLVVQGREWERYAYIKARAVTGKPGDILRLEKVLHAFIYRKYLDYASFDSLRDMKQNIVTEAKRKGLKNNIKIGTGGIREIEFFGQIFQLIRGGVEPILRERKILKILDLLCRKDYIPEKVKKELTNAYIFLRYTEHRLQEYSDAQTHVIPDDTLSRTRLAVSMGFSCWEHFIHNLNSHMKKVHYHFNQILSNPESPSESDPILTTLVHAWHKLSEKEPAIHDLKQVGFENAEQIYRIIDDLKNDPNTRSLSRQGKERLDKLIPVILKKTAKKKPPETLLNQIIDLVKAIQRRTCYISLLIENPTVIDHLIKLANESAWIITYLTRHPVLLDELLDTRTLHVPPEKKTMKKELKERLQKNSLGDLEEYIIETCIFKQVNTLRVAASDISGAFPLMKVSDYLTDLAEVIVEKVYNITWSNLTQKYGTPSNIPEKASPATGFSVIGFGKLGGIEFGYGSDLDLVFIHSAENGETSGGKQTTDNTQFYYRLGQKIIHFLTTRTPAGLLYEVDMRLRPSGNSGTIVTHVSSFYEYYKNAAWTWEHQALVRARPICGDKALSDRFNRIRKDILCQKREKQTLLSDIVSMRERIRKEHGNTDKSLFHLKQDAGGIVDIEFLVQFLVLANAYKHPEITKWTDNIRLLEIMNEYNIIDADSVSMLKKAYVALRARIHKLNLQEKRPLVPASEFDDHRKNVTQIREKYLTV